MMRLVHAGAPPPSSGSAAASASAPLGWRTHASSPTTDRRALPEGAVKIPLTERMALTRTNWPDIDDVVALNADIEVMRYLDHGRPMTPARVLAEEMPRLMAH